jgi:hypothetical protein
MLRARIARSPSNATQQKGDDGMANQTGTTGSMQGATGRMSGQQGQGMTGVRDETYDLISVIYHALQGAETYRMYEQDVQGNQELAQFFRQACEDQKRMAQQGKELLARHLQRGGGSQQLQSGSSPQQASGSSGTSRSTQQSQSVPGDQYGSSPSSSRQQSQSGSASKQGSMGSSRQQSQSGSSSGQYGSSGGKSGSR